MDTQIKPLLTVALTSFVIAYLIIPLIVKFSLKRNLVDLPGRRKIHKRITPSMGGIAIFIGFMISVFIWLGQDQLSVFKFVLVALGFIFLIGVRDDLLPLKVSGKLVGQVLAATILIFLANIRITSFYGVFGLYELNYVFSVGFTYLTIVFITNSFNLIDGLDGLAGMLAVISLILLGSWFYLAGDFSFSMLCFALMGAVLAFLIFNWDPSELFMGDTGALFIGLFLSMAIIRFAEVNSSPVTPSEIKFEVPIAAALSFLIIPVTDTIRIILVRLSKGLSPFKPDKSHIHHALIRLGLSHGKAVIILGTIQAGFSIFTIIFMKQPAIIILPAIISAAILLSILLDRMIIYRLEGKDSTPPTEL